MLSSIVSVSAVCLVLAFSGWDATDFPPGTDFHEEKLYQPGNYDLGQWRDGILQWLLIYNEDSDDDRDCCGMIKTAPNENGLTSPEQQNHTYEVFPSTIVTIEWKDPAIGHKVIDDSLIPNSHYLDGINIYTNTGDQISVHKPALTGSDDQASIHKPELTGTDDQASVPKPALTDTDDQASVHKPALKDSDDQASVHKPALTDSDDHASIHKPELTGIDDQASVHKQAVTGTDDQASVHKPALKDSDDQASVHKPALTDSDDHASIHKPELTGIDDQASVSKPALTGTDDQASVHKPALTDSDDHASIHKPELTGIDDQASVHKQAVTGTDDQKPISTDIYLPMWSFNFSNDQHNTTTVDNDQREGRPAGNLLDGIIHDHDREGDVTNVADDLLTLVISFLLAGVIYKYKFRGRRHLRLLKGVTLTPVLYRRGKHLELGLSKYLRHRSVSKFEIVFTPSFCLKDINYDRPGLELTRRFNPDFLNPWLESRLEINTSHLQENLPSIPGSSNTPNPYLTLTDFVIKSLEFPSAAEGFIKKLEVQQPEESLNSPSTMNLAMICDKKHGEPETSNQKTTDTKKKSLETQFVQLMQPQHQLHGI